MLRFYNIKRTALALLLPVAVLASCMEVEEQQGSAVGYLDAPELEVDVCVDNLTQTKAMDFEIEEPSVSDIRFVVRDKDCNVRYDADGLWADPLVLPAGAYSIEAKAGVNGFGSPYFIGSFSGSISALEAETPALTLSLANALVNVSVAESMKEHFMPGPKVSLNGGEYEAEYGAWFYVPSGKDINLLLSGRNSAGKDVTFTHVLTSPAAKTAYGVVCKASSTNWPSIDWTSTELSVGAFEGGLYFRPAVVSNMSDVNASAIKYQIMGGDFSDWTDVNVSDVEGYKYISGLSNGTEYRLRACVGNIVSTDQAFTPVSYASCIKSDVTAAHNNAGNPSVMLESTAVQAAVSTSLPAVIAELVTAQTATITFGNGLVKQATLNVNKPKQTLSNADGWPYLPKGSYPYKAIVTCQLSDGRTVSTVLQESVEVPAPEFKLTLSAYTSYDKYAGTNGITKDLNGTTGANNCDAATLYNAGGQWSISPALMANGNYDKTLVINIDGNTYKTINVTNDRYYEDISGLAWQAHTHQVSFTFDDKTVTSQNTDPHHITGLPYSAAPPKNTGDHPWTEDQRASLGGSNFNWGTSEFYMYDDAATGTYLKVGTPSFHVPNDIPISIVTSAHGCKHAALKHDVDCRIHSGQSTEDFTAKYNNGNYSDYYINTLSLYSSSPKLQFENRHHTAYRKLYINKVIISYR